MYLLDQVLHVFHNVDSLTKTIAYLVDGDLASLQMSTLLIPIVLIRTRSWILVSIEHCTLSKVGN